ncbi:hypothetical protein [Agaribacter marinus]|uniref:Uncharacterized protein n=1 Tax=Agaribacter marinus TaxID=1431249 RepID=A0AA37T0I4_9ALTE|nr:hypothetical protein [Agaribacter marinus]GLR71306.1 hypothetical protein GCM10007852_22140 [Agaribacter marinus]
MTNNSDALPSVEDNNELAALWQQQPALNVNVEEIVNLAKSQRRKQRFYISIDLLSILPWLVILSVGIELSTLLKIFFLVCASVATTISVYFIKLRWHSAFGQFNNTTEYINACLQQLRNNARIANLSMHLGWIAASGGIAVVLMQLYFGEDEVIGAAVRICIFIIWFSLWGIWAYKREKRFLNEVKALEAKVTN